MNKTLPIETLHGNIRTFEWVNIPDNPNTTGTTTTHTADNHEAHMRVHAGAIAAYSIPLTEEIIKARRDAHIDAISKNFTNQNHCSDELAYWLYNKDVPIPKLPKCMSSRVHSDRRLWGNGKKVKTPPVILDSGWLKEKKA